MPSVDNTPTIPELLRVYAGEVRTTDDTTDTHLGSNYDIWGGVSALLLSREAIRIRDIFRANYFDHARGEDLNEILVERFRDSRIVDGPGTGFAHVFRSSTAAGAGTFLQGTRVEVCIPNGEIRTYLITTDVLATATNTFVTLPVTSVALGTGAQTDSDLGTPILRIADPLWDNSWQVLKVKCSAGTVGETEEAAKARIRQAKRDARVGYPKRIIQACKDAGAANVVLFGSDYLDTPPGDNPVIGSLSSGYGDVGLNRIFVGDAGYVTSHSLLVQSRLAVASSAVMGTAVQVWGMTPTAFTCSITAQLWDDPGSFDQDSVKEEIRNAIADYFQVKGNAFYFRYVSLQGAVMRSVRSVQTLTFSGGPAEPSLLTFLNTALLPRYVADPSRIHITLTGP